MYCHIRRVRLVFGFLVCVLLVVGLVRWFGWVRSCCFGWLGCLPAFALFLVGLPAWVGCRSVYVLACIHTLDSVAELVSRGD